MVLEARTVAGEGVTITAETMADVEAGGLDDVAPPPPEFDGVLPLEPGGTCVVDPPEGDCTVPLESVTPVEVLRAALVTPLHPQPQSVRVMRKMTSRRNGDLLS
jgi:hypothetical protein